MILDNILNVVGNTPIVKLNKIGSDLKCNLLGKCEYFNPGGSIKDRIGANMIEQAEKNPCTNPLLLPNVEPLDFCSFSGLL